MHNHKNIPDLRGKIAIVTGANSGTGYGITYHLAKHGCTVIMASRNPQKLQDAKAKLLQEVPNASLVTETVDITDLSSIASFADRINTTYAKIDFLANNAGGGGSDYVKTVDGLEQNLTVNYLGHFALTLQLMPVLKDGSRIVTFSSIGYKRLLRRDLDVENLMCTDASAYNPMQEYCTGKICSVLFSVKLQREFERIGSTSKSLACHPGWARTSLFSQAGNRSSRVMQNVANAVSGALRLSHSLYDGALPAIEALVVDDVQTEKVYSPGGMFEGTGAPVAKDIDRKHFKESDIDALWIKSQELTGVKVGENL